MKQHLIKAPSKKEMLAIRGLIIIGLLSIVNFFYWFLDFDLIEDKILYWMLMSLILFDTFRVLYIWYHYWDISVPPKPYSTAKPTVDVFTTYFPGEPKGMLKETLIAIQEMSYPHTTYLCDEGNDEELKAFCEQHDIIHVTRDNRIDAKAGNINNALKQATGELCLILDPDHVPKVNFLEEVIPYFEDEKAGFIQTVQSYYNIDESKVAQAAAEQTFHFYGPVMMCMNSYGTVNAIGANCVFRRAALDSIGGHAAGLSEDMHTAMQLHAKGWTSKYVPLVLSAGLSPASLTSFFKQQLKWSRGTLELLVTAFPKLFHKLTLRQKLHYGILPLHYLTGLIYMISFLIPIVSLLSSTTPWKGNVLHFGLITFPVIASILGIRFYVQKWVINKGERGMHLLGGILLQITWSIYLMGLFYTIIRKKVPYLPTVKEDENKTSFFIVLPNLTICFVSLFAIVYGLMRDLTPFSLFMSGFALWNAHIMLSTLRFAYQSTYPIKLNFDTLFIKFNTENKLEKSIFSFWQKSAFIILTFTLIACGYMNYKKYDLKSEGYVNEATTLQAPKYLGVFAPQFDDGLSDMQKVSDFEQMTSQKVDIISHYVAWDKDMKKSFPEGKIKETYNKKAIPMITWEPWPDSFVESETADKHVFDLIIAGELDEYIEDFARKIKNLNRPVFLRFAHEFDNPFYPWYDEREQASDYFKKAWRHTHDIFDDVGAINAVWIYNPWKPDKVTSFFPGREYVDWIGVNILNYTANQQREDYFSFGELYKPYQVEIEKLGEYPIMIAEFGSVKDPNSQASWIGQALKDIGKKFNEIDALVYFYSDKDNNIPTPDYETTLIDWTFFNTDTKIPQFKETPLPDYLYQPLPKSKVDPDFKNSRIELVKNIQGVNLKNGQNWDQDFHVLNRKNLEYDLSTIKNVGLNTIKYTSNNIYDYNVINISREFGLQLSIGFWIPDDIDFLNDSIAAENFQEYVMDFLYKYKDQNHIIAWNLQNDVLSKGYLEEPRFMYQRAAFVSWLEELTSRMKATDPDRPIVLEMAVTDTAPKIAKEIFRNVKNLDVIGLVVKENSNPLLMMQSLEQWKIPYIFSDTSLNKLDIIDGIESNASFFITNWRDQHQIDKVTFDGLIDRKGRLKEDYFLLAKRLKYDIYVPSNPPIRILKTLVLLHTDKEVYYFAMEYNDQLGWQRMQKSKDIQFEWTLVKCDADGNFITLKEVGNDPVLLLKIPANYPSYRLRLSIISGGVVNSTMTTLNTPYNK